MNFDDMRDALESLASVGNRHAAEDEVVVHVVRAYFEEMYPIEMEEARAAVEEEVQWDALKALIERKCEVHRRYWCNQAPYYVPAGVASYVEHDWKRVLNYHVLRNGDREQPLFLFLFLYRSDPTNDIALRCIALRTVDGMLSIEHDYM
jgi:hypothetical protein